MTMDLTDWIIAAASLSCVVTCMIIYMISESLDDGWLGDYIQRRSRKHRKAEQAESEEPPFPLDRPNSCKYCKNNLCTGVTYMCNAYHSMDKHIEICWWSKDGYVFRTWDRCDNYEPHKICATCKYGPARGVITEAHIIGDEEVEITLDPSTKCPYRSECKHAEKWEPKEMSE